MKRILLLIVVCAVVSGCAACTDSGSSSPSGAVQSAAATGSPVGLDASMSAASGLTRLSFADGLSSRDIEKILYFDDSQPPDTPADTYTNAEEMERILDMFREIVLMRELDDDELREEEPGNFCGYEVYLKDGGVYTVWRSGETLSFDGKRYDYTGRMAEQLHIDEVVMSANGSIGYPPEGKMALYVGAYDERNTLIADNPVLKQFDGSRWTVVESAKPGSGAKVSVGDMPRYIDLGNYPQVTTGQFKMIYQVQLPSGGQIEVVVPFTVFEE